MESSFNSGTCSSNTIRVSTSLKEKIARNLEIENIKLRLKQLINLEKHHSKQVLAFRISNKFGSLLVYAHKREFNRSEHFLNI
jgi:hypothetical protein